MTIRAALIKAQGEASVKNLRLRGHHAGGFLSQSLPLTGGGAGGNLSSFVEDVQSC